MVLQILQYGDKEFSEKTVVAITFEKINFSWRGSLMDITTVQIESHAQTARRRTFNYDELRWNNIHNKSLWNKSNL